MESDRIIMLSLGCKDLGRGNSTNDLSDIRSKSVDFLEEGLILKSIMFAVINIFIYYHNQTLKPLPGITLFHPVFFNFHRKFSFLSNKKYNLIKLFMPRGGSRSSSRSPPSRSTATQPPPQTKPQAPLQQQQSGGGLLGGIGSTIMQGMAFGAGS